MPRNYWPTTEWRAIHPAGLPLDTEKLSKLESIIKKEHSNINGIVVVKNGYLAFEKYYNGYSQNDVHHMASVTKSILSALIGIAIDTGYIKDVDQKVLDFFPEYISSDTDRQKQEITIRHLLTMTAPYRFEDWHEPLDKMCTQSDWVTYSLDILGQNGRIGTFKYSTASAHLLSSIITRSTGKNAREFANERLFTPIGMKKIPDYEMKAFGYDDLFGKNIKGWVNDPQGNSTGGWGLTLTPRDMARFGFLYLNHGIWNNRQILSKTWTLESIAMNPNNYGFLWWLREEDGLFAYSALGDGGNVICCIPAKDLVIAIASEIILNASDRWTLIKEQIIPAVFD